MSTLGPYADALGVVVAPGSPPSLRLPFGEHLFGRPGFLHGGAITGLLELAAVATLRAALSADAAQVSLLTIAVDFLRGGIAADAFAAASIRRTGRRVAHLDALAWQEDRDRPIAAARITLRIARD